MPDRFIAQVHISPHDTDTLNDIAAVANGELDYLDLVAIDRTSGAEVTVRVLPAIEENEDY